MRYRVLLIALLYALPASAAEHYIWPSATGAGTGANCTNAYTGFGSTAGKINPASMTSGDTYWLLAGSYGTVTWSSANVWMQAATSANHGAASDCGSAFGLVSFSSSSIITSSVTIHGQAVVGCTYPSNNSNCYNIVFNYTAYQSGSAGGALNLGKDANHAASPAIHYIMTNGGGFANSTGSFVDYGIWVQGGATSVQVDHSYLYNPGNANVQDNDMSSGQSNGEVWEYNWFCCNHGNTGNHSEAFATTASNLIIRKNVFQDIQSTGLIVSSAGPFVTCSNWEVYGNLIFRTDAFVADTTHGDFGDGLIANISCTPFNGHVYFYNNTIANIRTACGGCAISSGVFDGSAGWSSGAPTLIAENNIWWNSVDPADAPSGQLTLDYNSYFGGTTNTSDTGAHKQTSASNPFTNYSLNSIAGYQLVTDTTVGLTLTSPYNADMLAVTRGANGTWDRGALQLAGSGGSQAGNCSESLTTTASASVFGPPQARRACKP